MESDSLNLAPISHNEAPENQGAAHILQAASSNTSLSTYFLHVVSGLCIAALSVYGFLSWAEVSQKADAQTAAAVRTITISPFDAISLQAQSAFVVDLFENKVLYARNADVQLPLASITKIALVLVVSEVLSNEETVEISSGAVARGEGGLTEGEKWRVKDLIDYTLVASSNVGAEALAEAAEKNIQLRYPQAPEGSATVWRMNALSQELNLTKTYFLNASGLDVSPTQPGAMSSARDATILLAYAFKTAPEFFKATENTMLTTGPLNGPSFTVENTNDAVSSIPGLLIGKTGYTDLAGGNLSIVFNAEASHPIVATVMGSTLTGRFDDMRTLAKAAQEFLARQIEVQ